MIKLTTITPHLRILKTINEQARGLRFSNIQQNEAVLFPLPQETRINALVDMLFVFMPLGILWLDKNKKIVDIKQAQPFCFYLPQQAASYVLEIHPNKLKKFRKGQTLSW
ncbi:MAG: DUF192 domain-containing protein [Nanoarchaeota archaeon]|nr:DUF192 domain-containing protein [Nanoarchaeota archaeon]